MDSSRERGSVQIDQLASEVLRGNPLGDPTERPVAIYLPPDYGRDLARRYPVLYFLAGFTGTGRSFLNWNAWQLTLPERLDLLIREGRMPPVIAVFPDCFTRLGGSQYVNSGALGRYEDYLCDEVVPFVDGRYRTLGASARGILGRSSGGIGALWLAARRPTLFRAAASHSGDCAFELSMQVEFPSVAVALAKQGGVAQVLSRLSGQDPPSGGGVELLSMLCCAAAYSPQPAPEPWGFSLPFDEETGSTRADIFSAWLEFDPVRFAARYRDSLSSLALLYFDAGRSDEYHLQLGARLLSREMKRLGIPHRHEEFDGGHRGNASRYDISLPALAEALQR
jgi:enterochelin esterase-like enzyme